MRMNRYLNKLLQTEGEDYVIASDTDSIYLNLGPLLLNFLVIFDDKTKVVGILDQICEDKLEPFIEQSYQNLADYVSCTNRRCS